MGMRFDSTRRRPPGLRVDSAELPGRVRVLRVAGEIDILTAPDFEVAIDHDLSQAPAALVIDLSRITFIDSSGLAALFGAQRRATCTVRVVVTPAIGRILDMVGMRDTLELHADLDDATRELTSRLDDTDNRRLHQ